MLLGLALFLFAATVDFALNNLSRGRIHQLVAQGVGNARLLEPFVDSPSRHIVAAQVLRTLAGVLTTAAAALLAISAWGAEPMPIVVLALAVFVLQTLLLSFPRGVAVRDPERTLLRLYYPAMATSAVLGPIVRVLNRVGGIAAKGFGLSDVSEGPVLTTDDLLTHASAAREAGVIEESEREMIDSIIELDTTSVREIMVPRMDVTALPASATVDQALDVMAESGYSRVPVYEGSIDEIVGILYAKDLLKFRRPDDGAKTVRELVRPAHVVPESKKTDELLRELQKSRVHIAVVIDEYGGTAGIVTIEDLLEEIVGEIQDEYDHEDAKIVEVSLDEAIFSATVSIDDVNDALDLDLQSGEVDTIGGLLYERLGKVPAMGDAIEMNGVKLSVESTSGRRIRKVRVRRSGPTREPIRHAS